MNIVVAGCGKIGTVIIKSLLKEGHTISVMDIDRDKVKEVVDIYDVLGVEGSAADSDALMNVNADKADIFIAATGSDEINMLGCFFARKLGARHTVARIRDTSYNDTSLDFIKKNLQISVAINPEAAAAREVFNILRLPSAVKIETFSTGSIEMVELKLRMDSALDDITLSEMRNRYKAMFLVGVVQRGEQVYIPDGNFTLKSGDRIGLIAAPAEIQKLFRKLNLSQKQAKNIMIFGGSRMAFYLAKRLLSITHGVKVIERTPERCKAFEAEIGDECDVICGDGAQQDFLIEEGIRSMDAFVSLTGIDEENILMSIFASSQEVPKVVSKVNRDELGALAEKLGVETIISPGKTISNVIVRYARALQNSAGSKVETLYKLMDDKAEALEFTVGGNFKAVNVPLKNMAIKADILIAGIIRERKTIIPSGNDVILPEDKVIVVSCGKRLEELSDILK